jgi:hypothetical protein
MASPSDPKASRLEEEALRLARHGSFRAAGDVCRVLNTQHPQFASGWRTSSAIGVQLEGLRRRLLAAGLDVPRQQPA